MQTTQGNASVFESHAANQGTICKEGNVHGREGKEGVHDKWGGSTNSKKPGKLVSKLMVGAQA